MLGYLAITAGVVVAYAVAADVRDRRAHRRHVAALEACRARLVTAIAETQKILDAQPAI